MEYKHNYKKSNQILSYFRAQLVPVIVLSLMIIIAVFLSTAFFTAANLKNLIVQVSLNMIVSMGMLCVIVTGGIELSVGSQVALSGILIAGLMRTMPLALAALITIVAVTLAGAVNGFIVSKAKIAPFIVTLGMMAFARGCAYWYSQSASISWRGFNGASTMKYLGSGNFAGIPMPAVTWIVVAILMALMLKYTVLGRILYSLGGNEEAVRLSGINLGVWKAVPYIIAGFLCALGGIVLTARLGVGSVLSGEGLEVDCIAATVIGGASLTGGRGTVLGVIIGVFILGIINNLLDLMNVAQYPQMMLKGTIVVVAVILSTVRVSKKVKSS